MKKEGQRNGWNLLIKGGVALLLIYALYHQVFAKAYLKEMVQAFSLQVQAANKWWFVLTILLLPLNWILETLKWQTLLRSSHNIPFQKAFKAVLSGVTLSLFTPNRIGEYGGRVLVLNKKEHWPAIFATFVGGLCQLAVIVLIGLPAIFYFANEYWLWDSYQLESAFYWGGIFTIMLILGLFNIKPILKKLESNRWIKKQSRLLRSIQQLQKFESTLLLKALCFAFFRYLVYSLQYYFMIRFFDFQVDVWSGLMGIASVFLIQTSLPLPPFLGLLARGELALLVWGNFESNDIIILAATFSLFIINLSLPALLGTIVIIKTNVLKSFGYDKKVE